MHDGFDGMFLGGGFMWIIWIILFVVLIYILKDFTPDRNQTKNDEDALEILKKRYARGEIDEQEYARRRNELER
jgi:putative membrane protein